jgi:hypothetical protein
MSAINIIFHSLDWFISGDTSEEKFISDYEKIYNMETK